MTTRLTVGELTVKFDKMDGFHCNFHSKWPVGFNPADAGLPENYLKCYIWAKILQSGEVVILRGGIPLPKEVYPDLYKAVNKPDLKKMAKEYYRSYGGAKNPLTKFISKLLG